MWNHVFKVFYFFKLKSIFVQSCSYLWYSSFLISCSWAPNLKWMPVLLVYSTKTHLFDHSTHVFKFVFNHHWFTRVCTQALTQVVCIANTLQVLIACYVFTQVCNMHYLSTSNSPVPVRIGNHTPKCRALILLVITNFYNNLIY